MWSYHLLSRPLGNYSPKRQIIAQSCGVKRNAFDPVLLHFCSFLFPVIGLNNTFWLLPAIIQQQQIEVHKKEVTIILKWLQLKIFETNPKLLCLKKESYNQYIITINASAPNWMLFLVKLTLLFKGKQLCHAQFPQFSECEDRPILLANSD